MNLHVVSVPYTVPVITVVVFDERDFCGLSILWCLREPLQNIMGSCNGNRAVNEGSVLRTRKQRITVLTANSCCVTGAHLSAVPSQKTEFLHSMRYTLLSWFDR